jgi:hypothetical protein
MTTRTGVSTVPIIGQSPLLGLTPWIIYWLVAGSSDTWVLGGVCALLASVLLGVSIGRGAPKALDAVTLAFFAAVTVAGTVVGAGDRNWLDTYAMTLSSGVLAVVVLGSLYVALPVAPFARRRFTWRYPRMFAARQMWRQPAFESSDRALTLMWCLVFTDIALLGFVSATALPISNWIMCAISVTLVAAAVRVTRRVPTGRVAIPAPSAALRDRFSPMQGGPRLPVRIDWKPIDHSGLPVLGRSYAAGPAGTGVVHRIPPAGGENLRQMHPAG